MNRTNRYIIFGPVEEGYLGGTQTSTGVDKRNIHEVLDFMSENFSPGRYVVVLGDYKARIVTVRAEVT